MAGEATPVPGSDPVTTQNNGNNKNGNQKQTQYPNSPKSGGNGKHTQYPNPPDPHNPDLAGLRKQWKVPLTQYIKWSSNAWSAAIFVGISSFALGWFIRGSDHPPPISTSKSNEDNNDDHDKPRSTSWSFETACMYRCTPQLNAGLVKMLWKGFISSFEWALFLFDLFPVITSYTRWNISYVDIFVARYLYLFTSPLKELWGILGAICRWEMYLWLKLP